MTDTVTKQPLKVLTDALAGSYLVLPTSQVDQIRQLLEANTVRFWVDRFSISYDGKPAVSTIYLKHDTNPQQVQSLLDSVV